MIKTLNNDYAFVNIVGNLSYKEIYINWRKEIDIAFNEDELIMLKRQYHLRILNPFNREIKKYLIRNIIPDIVADFFPQEFYKQIYDENISSYVLLNDFKIDLANVLLFNKQPTYFENIKLFQTAPIKGILEYSFSKQNTNDDNYVISYWLKHNKFISKHLQWFYKVLLDIKLTERDSSYWEKLFNWLISYLNYLIVSLLNQVINTTNDFRFYNEFKVENSLNIVTLDEWLWNKDIQDDTLLHSIEKTLELEISKTIN